MSNKNDYFAVNVEIRRPEFPSASNQNTETEEAATPAPADTKDEKPSDKRTTLNEG